MTEEQQTQRNINRAADPGCDLRERHQVHAVAGGQNRHVAGTALTALAAGGDVVDPAWR